MIYFAPRSLRTLAAVLMLALVGLALAQDGNAAVRAVIGSTNLLDPALVTELQPEYPEEQALALALLEEFETAGILSPALAAEMEAAILAGVLPRDTFIIFLADLANGTDPAPASVEEAAVELQALSPGLTVPAGDENGNLSEEDVASVVTYIAEDTDGLLVFMQSGYDAAITPTTGG